MSAFLPPFSEPTVSFEAELPEGIESLGPFRPPNPADLPPPIRPGSPTTIKIRRGPWPDLGAASRRRGIREGKKPEMARRSTIGGEDAASRQTKSFFPSMPFFRRAKTSFGGSENKSNTDDCPPLLDVDQGDGKDSRPSSSGSEKTERRFSLFRRTNKISRPVARPRVQRNKTDGRGANTSFDDRLRLVRTLNELLAFSSTETTPSGTDTETCSSPLGPSPRTSLFCPPAAQMPKEPEPQWLPMGSAMVAWTSVPRSSTWLQDLERHLDSSQKVIESLPRETQGAISELRQQQASRKPGREVYFVERPGRVFDLRTWDENAPFDEGAGSSIVAEGEGTARPGGLRQRMDSARASISKSLQWLVGRKNSSSTSD